MATVPNPKTTRARREPALRPRSNNVAAAPAPAPAVASVRRGPAASAEKENQPPKSLGHGKAAAAATAAEPAPVVAPPPPPLRPSSLQLRMKDEAAAAPPAFVVGPRGRELLPPPSSNYEAWDLSDSESAPASSWATLPNRYAASRRAARPSSAPRTQQLVTTPSPFFPLSLQGAAVPASASGRRPVHVRHRQGGGHRRPRRRALLPLHQCEIVQPSSPSCLVSQSC
jgi:hypothetical protein